LAVNKNRNRTPLIIRAVFFGFITMVLKKPTDPIPDISPGFSENLRKIKCACTTTGSLPVLLRKLPVLCSFLNNQTQQFFDSDFPFPPKRTWNCQFSDSEGF
jgi:hypothetical protein